MRAQHFEVAISERTLDQLRIKLAEVPWPEDPGNADWRYGVERGYLQELVAYWRDEYDWRHVESKINEFANFRVELDDVPIHFIHERGVGPDPIPLVLTHGWPWTFWDYHKVIGPLADPGAHGGDPADAFDVVVPSLPGYGFSAPLRTTGVQFINTAERWLTLMRDVLGYDRFGAYGGDWGTLVTTQLGHRHAAHLIGVQVGFCIPLDVFAVGMPPASAYAADEMDRLEHNARMAPTVASHLAVHTSDPQTLGYALQDSPVGTAAWILERHRAWSACDGDVERCFSKEDLVTTAMLYWATGTITSSMRYYWEAQHAPWQPSHDRLPVVEAPTGVVLWADEVVLPPQAWVERYYNLVRTATPPKGGHFHPMEQPERLVSEIRDFFRELRP